MTFRIDPVTCINCSICRRACPTDTIHYYDTPDLTHTIYPEQCIDCAKCVPVCPVDAITFDPTYVHDPDELAAAKEIARRWAKRNRAGDLDAWKRVERA